MSYWGVALLSAALIQPAFAAGDSSFFKILSKIKSSFEKPTFVQIHIQKPAEDFASIRETKLELLAGARKSQDTWFFNGDLRFTAKPIFMGDPDFGFNFWDHETNARYERWGSGYNIRGTYKKREIDFHLSHLWENEYEVHTEGADLRTFQLSNGLVMDGNVNLEKFTREHLELLSAVLAILYDPKIEGRPNP